MSSLEVQGIIQDVFGQAEQDLDADGIIGKLFSDCIISCPVYQSICKKETSRDKNRALLAHLYEVADEDTLKRLCTFLENDKTRPKQKKLGCCIREKLEYVLSNSKDEAKRYLCLCCRHYTIKPGTC